MKNGKFNRYVSLLSRNKKKPTSWFLIKNNRFVSFSFDDKIAIAATPPLSNASEKSGPVLIVDLNVFHMYRPLCCSMLLGGTYIYISLCLSIYLSIYKSIYFSNCLSIYIYLSINLSIYLSSKSSN